MSGHDVANQYSILYSLPKGAEQGKEGWYICHLDFEVEFDDSTSPGLFYLIAFTNGYACAQIKFQVKKDNNGINVNWSTVDLVNGGIHRSQKTSIVHGTFNNYVQLAGVRPGENNLTLQTRRLGDVKVNNIFIDGKKSGIEYTEASPPLLNLEMELPNTYGLTVGDRFTLGFTLENLSGFLGL
jgi:hypothetical protein